MEIKGGHMRGGSGIPMGNRMVSHGVMGGGQVQQMLQVNQMVPQQQQQHQHQHQQMVQGYTPQGYHAQQNYDIIPAQQTQHQHQHQPLHAPQQYLMGDAVHNEGESDIIVDVWADQLEEVFDQIRATVVDYPYVAMDTEFPGVVARPVGNFKSNTEFYYQTLRCNVNLLKIIQLGITFSDEYGKHPPGACTWQFNFKFNLTDDIYAQDSIDLLTGSGIDFDRFARDGIDVATFAELLTSSGLVLSSDPPVKWLSFHSGYDFGYLIKVLTNNELPSEEEEFFELMNTYFPLVFDVKYLLKQTGGALSDMCGLNKLGDNLDVERIGPAHQAGSDSLLTAHCFFKLCQDFFPNDSVLNHCGVLYGLGQDKGSDVGQSQNGWTNPAITPSTPAGNNGNSSGNSNSVVQNGSNNNISQFPSSPSAPIRGPQPGLYNQMRNPPSRPQGNMR
eukprot:TRINITY_DN6065_c0_g1_i1.p1 TRINITY_DN6065_c0_g1~~TRINITY_DN6065_c0_g1_i1.p1  ORF type:complete len:445 (+),score=92.81 TRINITY_DN6065_c0_g1_i1:51-1385(+)